MGRNGKRSSGSGGLCSSSAGVFSITHLLKIFLVLSTQEFQVIRIKDSFFEKLLDNLIFVGVRKIFQI